MTTIAYKNGIVAYDSRISADNLIQDDDYEKHIVRDGIHFFVCGATEDWMKFVESYCNQTNPERHLDVSALVLHGGELFKSSIEKTDDQFRVWKSPIRLASHISIGSDRERTLTLNPKVVQGLVLPLDYRTHITLTSQQLTSLTLS